MALDSINPATGELIQSYPEMDSGQVAGILEAVQEAFLSWSRIPPERRAAKLQAAAGILRSKKEDFGRLMSREMGKPLDQAVAEAEKCAWVCEYYAQQGPGFLEDQPIDTEASKSYVALQPLGIILAVMPWNFPFWQVFRFAAPALVAGNAAVLKHSSHVQGCALAIEALFEEAGFPKNLFRTLVIGAGKVAVVIEHPLVRAVTITGSTPAGRAVAAVAGAELKKTVLELGGNDPYLILEDADLETAAEACIQGRLINTGQSCIAAKRYIVHQAVKSRFEDLVVTGMAAKTSGDPLQGPVDLGPLVSPAARDQLHDQVTRSIEQGARLLLGGEVPVGVGAYYPPTVLSDVIPGMVAFEEELFGPVAAIIAAGSEQEAIELANLSPFGLGAAVFTRDVEKGERIARQELQAGSCFVNDFVRSDPRLPFGGIKGSGYGRELSESGLHEFVNVKTVYLK